jgi:hypothetical protein
MNHGGSGGEENSIHPDIDIPGQSLLSDVIGVHFEMEIGSTVDVKHIPSHEKVWILQKLNVTKTDIFALCTPLGLVPSSNFIIFTEVLKMCGFSSG